MGILGDIGAFANPYGAPSAGQWNLTKGIYTSSKNERIVFFYEMRNSGKPSSDGVTLAPSDLAGETKASLTAIDQISDDGGRRLAIYEYPYVDGQKIKDLGKKGETFTFNIKFFGANYQQRFADFKRIVIGDSGTGTINHPVLDGIQGTIPVKLSDWNFIHRHDEWNAVSIRAVFKEDNTNGIAIVAQEQKSTDSALRELLQLMVDVQATIGGLISDVGALLLLPTAIQNSFKIRLNAIITQVSNLLGQLAATFSNSAQLKSLAAQAKVKNGNIPGLSSGSTISNNGGSGSISKLPPVFQVGFDPVTQKSITAQTSSFVSANQISSQQAVFAANQIRSAILAELANVAATFGNDGFDIQLAYKQLANGIQAAVEASLASTVSQVKIYTVPYTMSLRKVAFLNNLTVDRQNDIESLNPYIASVNYITRGTKITVPAK